MTTTASNLQATDLTTMSSEELIVLFRILECPTMAEMTGEFSGTPLRQPNLSRTALALLKVRNPFYLWRTKGFRQIDENSGRGYNVHHWTLTGKLVYRDPMTTQIAPARIDHKPAFQLDYRTFKGTNGLVNLVDDVRRVRPGLYLGFGMLGFTYAQQRVMQPFMLEGTDRPYAGDVGAMIDGGVQSWAQRKGRE
ncbi:hypothetical protein [Streptomyces parvulus]|uniref:hypothetical protein n=1 Tax=Streptomyces parvulus TaxID=146923 RepID=UPI0037D41112